MQKITKIIYMMGQYDFSTKIKLLWP
jgi:hypothetical protein